MKEILVEREVVKELSKKQNKKEVLIQIMIESCVEMGYNVKEGKEIICDFYKEIYLSKTCP